MKQRRTRTAAGIFAAVMLFGGALPAIADISVAAAADETELTDLRDLDIFYIDNAGDEVPITDDFWSDEFGSYQLGDLFYYDGTSKMLSVVIRDSDGRELILGEDYEFLEPEDDWSEETAEHFRSEATEPDWYWTGFRATEYANNEPNPYGGFFSISWGINPVQSISGAEVTMVRGTAEVESVILPDGRELERDFDYAVSYRQGDTELDEAPTEPGTYTVVITGVGDFAETVEQEFELLTDLRSLDVYYVDKYGNEVLIPKDCFDPEFNSYQLGSIMVYNGNPRTMTIVVRDADGKALTLGREYARYVPDDTWEADSAAHFYSEPVTEVDWYWTGFFTPESVDNEPNPYSGSFSVAWGIAPRNQIFEAEITMADYSAEVASVVQDGVTLTEGTDYTVSYMQNGGGLNMAPTEPGEYTVVIIGIGEYEGSQEMDFLLEPAPFPEINTQPETVTDYIGETAHFTASTAGDGLTYQWQYNAGEGWKKSNGTGAQTDTLSFSVSAGKNGYRYRCVITNIYGNQTVSDEAALYVKTKITAQPADISAPIGEQAKFTVKATGVGLTYQWQYNKGDGWKTSNGTGSKTNTLTINTAAGYNGYQYRCTITDANGAETVSDAAKLAVKTAVTAQPADASAPIGEQAKFTVKATGASLTYQWQYNKGDGWKTSNGTGSKTNTLTINTAAGYNGYQYRCVITDANGAQTVSDAAKLTVRTVITTQPKGYQAALNEAAKFTVAATGAGLTYQWQYNAGDGWKNSGATGNKTAALTIYGKTTYNGWKFRCVITDANGLTTTSSVATLKIRIAITAQPTDISAAIGETAKFTVKATGLDLTYQWQYNAGAGWKNSGAAGAATATLSISTKTAYNGYQYRCVITDGNGKKAISDAAALTVRTKITAQPASVEAASGKPVSFTVKATGMELSYQWQYNAGAGWKTSNGTGAQTDTLTIHAKATYDGWQYRCVITDANGVKAVSDAAVLTLK